jgi:hypothetical protein
MEYDSELISANESRTTDSFFSLPSVLRGAAYISSGGRIYRLFPEYDENSLQLSSLRELFQCNLLPELPPMENLPLEDLFSLTGTPATSSDSPLQSLSEPLEKQAGNNSGNRSDSCSDHCCDSQPEKPAGKDTLDFRAALLTDSLSKLRSNTEKALPVLSIKNSPTTVQSKTNSVSAIVQHGRKPSAVCSATALPELASMLKLFEAVPDAALPESGSGRVVSKQKVPPAPNPPIIPFPQPPQHQTLPLQTLQPPTTPAPPAAVLEKSNKEKEEPNRESDDVPTTDVVSMIQTNVHQPPSTDKAETTEKISGTKESVASIIDGSEVSVLLSVNSVDSVNSVPEVMTAKIEMSAESETWIFPQQEPVIPLPVSSDPTVSPPSSADLEPQPYPQQEHRVWQLIWQSHWPEYLQSLESAASDQIGFLADHLEMLQRCNCRTISFNGFYPGDGCTTLALCAARELAERGYRVLLADAHRQNPVLPKLLCLKTDPHLYEIITLIQNSLEFLPWTETAIEIASPNVPYMQSFAEIIQSFRNDYDFILLDNGSLIESPLAERVLFWQETYSDGVLLVLNKKNPAPVNVQNIAHRLRQYHINLLGVVENYV